MYSRHLFSYGGILYTRLTLEKVRPTDLQQRREPAKYHPMFICPFWDTPKCSTAQSFSVRPWFAGSFHVSFSMSLRPEIQEARSRLERGDVNLKLVSNIVSPRNKRRSSRHPRIISLHAFRSYSTTVHCPQGRLHTRSLNQRGNSR